MLLVNLPLARKASFFNAVPQRQTLNAGIWLDLELMAGALAPSARSASDPNARPVRQ
jgi:hypothetical protein